MITYDPLLNTLNVHDSLTSKPKPFNKEECEKFIKFNNAISGYFISLIREGYEITWENTIRLGNSPYVIVNFVGPECIGDLDIRFDYWLNKFTLKDYNKEKIELFDDAVSIIDYFKEVYLPILEAEKAGSTGSEKRRYKRGETND